MVSCVEAVETRRILWRAEDDLPAFLICFQAWKILHGPGAREMLRMEYVFGRSLEEILNAENGTLPLDPALQVTQELAEALDYAHSQGIAHRDVKPISRILRGHQNLAHSLSAAARMSATAGPCAEGKRSRREPVVRFERGPQGVQELAVSTATPHASVAGLWAGCPF